MHSWKSFSAKEINKITDKTGSVWQAGYWNRLLRNEEHLWKTRRYIEKNPAKAGLTENEFLLYKRWQ